MSGLVGAPPRRILVALPNWVGDVVMASPVLAALRAQVSDAHIAFLMRPYVNEIVEGCGWHDAEFFWPATRGFSQITPTRELVRSLRAGDFGTALLLTNSLRSALVTWAARIPRRVGYARDGRTLLLTDRLKPLKRDGEFVPTPLLPYYCAIAETIGCPVGDRRLRLGVSPKQEAAGAALLQKYGLRAPYAAINPGAAFGAAKCWLPERFAEVCDRLADESGLRSIIVGAPGEIPLMRMIAERTTSKPIVCDDPPTTLGTLKVVIREAALLICNDTGPRHYGNAFGVPTVTIFGPTHQEWTHTDYEREARIQVKVECGPCQLRTCPIDHRCMKGVTAEMVLASARRWIREATR